MSSEDEFEQEEVENGEGEEDQGEDLDDEDDEENQGDGGDVDEIEFQKELQALQRIKNKLKPPVIDHKVRHQCNSLPV